MIAAAAEAGYPAQVVCVVTEHLREIHRKIAELQSMSTTLGDLVAACSGDHRPYGPILSNLARISDG